MKGRTLVLLLGTGVLLTLAALVAVPLLALRSSPLKPVTPPLLRSVTAAGGWNNMGCPRPAHMAFDPGKEALSPDLTSRLGAAFPRGSDADALESVLLVQGFRLNEPCRDDPSIHRASFAQTGGLAGPFPISAVVAWKRTATGQVAWTKGFVSYRGP